MMAASPAQKASGEIPVLGVASLAMKSNKTGAIFSPWASIRFMMEFFSRQQRRRAVFRAKSPTKGPVESPFSSKAGAMRRALAGPDCPIEGLRSAGRKRSDIGGEVDQFVEQNA